VWLRPHTTLSQQQDQKLMFGLLFSLKSFTAKMDPVGCVSLPFLVAVLSSFASSDRVLVICRGNKGNLGMPSLPGQGCSFHSFRTNTYKLSFMESPSGIKVMGVEDVKPSLTPNGPIGPK